MNSRWSPFAKQVVIAGSLIGMIWLLARMRVVLAPLVLALLLAYLLSHPINWLWHRTGWPRTLFVAIAYLLVVVVITVGPAVIVPRLLALGRGLSFTIFGVLRAVAQAIPSSLALTPTLTIDLRPIYDPVNEWLRSTLQLDLSVLQQIQTLLFPVASGAAVVARVAVTTVVWVLFILAVSFYVAKDAPMMGRWVAARLPEGLRPELVRLWSELSAVWNAFALGQFSLSIIVGLTVWALTTILGIRSAPILGLLSGVAEFVPGVGPVLAAIAGIAVALTLGSTYLPLSHLWLATILGLMYLSLAQFENLYLLPRIVGRRISLHPVVVIVGAIAGTSIGGVLGILWAAPTIASLRVLFGYAVHKLLDEEPFPAVARAFDPAVLWQDLMRTRTPAALIIDLDGALIEPDHAVRQRLTARLRFLPRIFPNVHSDGVSHMLLVAGDVLAGVIITILRQLRLRRAPTRLNCWLSRLRGLSCSPGESMPVPGAIEALRRLAPRYSLGLTSDREHDDVQAFLVRQGVVDLFGAVVTRHDVTAPEPSAPAIRSAARRLGVPPARVVVVGDTGTTVWAARVTGSLSVAVLSGVGREADLRGADLVIPSVANLEAWLPQEEAQGADVAR